MPSSSTPCFICSLPSKLNAVAVDPHWTLNIAEGAIDRPWLVLQCVRHVPSMGLLNEAELKSLGQIQHSLIKHLDSLPSVQRAHMHYLNETVPSHVHIHFTVSTAGDAKSDISALLGVRWPESQPAIPRENWMPEIQSDVVAKKEPSFLVKGIVKFAHKIQKLNFIYPAISRLLKRFNIESGFAAEIYVLSSLCVFIAGLFLSSHWKWAAAVLAVLGVVRLVDIWATQVAILLDRQARLLKGFERTLVLAVMNCLELATIVGIWGIYFFDFSTSVAFSFGFQVASNRSELVDQTSHAAQWIDIIGTSTSLMLLIAVVAMALGRLTSDRFEESAD
jgi:diadenosine tetraphosphate (Ap4A) HIT family hydrolase